MSKTYTIPKGNIKSLSFMKPHQKFLQLKVKAANTRSTSSDETGPIVFKDGYYYDLQGYVEAGVKIPYTSANEFQSKVPRTDLADLEKLDSKIYDQSRDWIVAVYTHCKDFQADGLQKFIPVCRSIIVYEQSVAKAVSGTNGISAKVDYIVANNDKSPMDDETKRQLKLAGEYCKSNLTTLAKGAETTVGEVETLEGKLRAFRDLTVLDSLRMKGLHQQFMTGPLVDFDKPISNPNYNSSLPESESNPKTSGWATKTVNNPWFDSGKPESAQNSKTVKCYSDVLTWSLNNLRNQAEAAANEARHQEEEYKHDVIVASTTPAYAWIGPYGLITAATVAGVYGSRAVEAKDKWEKALKESVEKDAKVKTLTSALTALQRIVSTNDIILAKIDKGLAACKFFIETFSGIATDLRTLKVDFDTAVSNVDDEFFMLLKENMVDAAKHWTDVKDKCKTFIDVESTLQWQNV